MEDYEQVFEDFWKKIVCNPDGSINLDQVKKELYDWHNAIVNVPKVYDHISGGKCSKVNTDPVYLIDCFEEAIEDAHKEGYDEAKQEEGW